MNCPRCNSNVLDERERNGVTVDVCPACRGVWLDRGELEKLLAFAKRDLEEERSHYVNREGPPSSDRRPGYVEQRGQHDSRHGQYRKKGWLENLGDIFD